MMKYVNDCFLVLDDKGMVLDANEKVLTVYGYTIDELTGLNIRDLTATEMMPLIEKQMSHIVRRHGYVFETIHKRKDNTSFPVEISSVNVDIDGKKHFLSTIRDISERKRVEKTLTLSERRYRLMFENMASCAAVYRMAYEEDDFFIVDFNAAAEKTEDIEKKDVIGKKLRTVFPGIVEFGLFEVLQRVWWTGVPERHPISFYEDGRISGWRKNYVYKLPSGEIVALYEDMTEKVQHEKEIQKLSTVVSQSPVVVVITDVNGIIEYVNPKFTDMTGYTPEEARGRTPRILKSGKHSPEFYTKMWSTIKAGETWRGEIVNKKKTGELYVEDTKISPIKDESGSITHFVAIKEDITVKKHKDMMLMLNARQAKMGEMLSMIAHQWRQPLTAIGAAVSNLEIEFMFDTVDKTAITDSLESVKKQIQHLSQTINDFRNFFKLDKKRETVDLKTVIGKCLSIIGKQFENQNIRISQQLPDIKIETYVNELIQVFLSLLENAKDVIEERSIDSPEIVISCREENGYVSIMISDNAGGISPHAIEDIFLPYFSTKEELQGTGLGLYMAKMIVEEHCKGEIFAFNDEKGACFTVKLPLTVR